VTRVIDFLDHGLSRNPQGECLREGDLSFSHREVQQHTHRIANALRAAGIGKGARVAFLTPNSAIAFIGMIAVFRAEAVWLPVHPRNTVEENAEFLRQNDCDLLFYHTRTAAEAEQFRASVPSLKRLACLDAATVDGPAMLDWAAAYPDRFAESATTGPDDIAWVKGTGGTTGRSKSVLITNRNVAALFATFNWCMPAVGGHRMLAAAPISHGAGSFALCGLTNGGSTVFIERAAADLVLDAIERYRITTLFLPPTVIYNMLARHDVRSRDYSSLKYLIYSAAPIAPERLHEALSVFGPVLAQTYGQTEAPVMLTYMSPEEHATADEAQLRRRLRSCGRRTAFASLEVMDDAGRILGPNEVGEIVVRGDLVMRGYHDNPEETEKVSRYGWHHTGDVGTCDEDGYFYIVDRKKDMIISGGFNIFPSEIEHVLCGHPSVLDCAVVGIPDPKWGEAVTAIVQLKPGASADTAALRGFCRERLGGLKTPKRFEIWEDLPRSSAGKVLKREIRERFWHGQARRV
jgi:acyl-CoA synthetase (AMP-forming)/AMP-acid ligase II